MKDTFLVQILHFLVVEENEAQSKVADPKPWSLLGTSPSRGELWLLSWGLEAWPEFGR